MVGAVLLGLTVSLARQQAVARDPRGDAGLPHAALRGRVVAADDGGPIRNARVSLAPEKGDGPDPVLTDNAGRFQFADLPAARYTLTAAKPGFATAAYGERRALDPPRTIPLGPGTTLDGIELRLARGAAISGRVSDENGEAMIGARVVAGQVVRSGRTTRLVPARSTDTDDLGEYRLGGLATGSYVVLVHPGPVPARGFLISSADPPAGPSYTETYYPGTPSLAQARPIFLQSGQEVTAADIAMRAMRTPRITVSLNAPPGAPLTGRYQFVPRGPLGGTGRGGAFSGDTFSTSVEPGEWLLVVNDRQGNEGIVPLSISDEDLTAAVAMNAGASLSGRIVLDGAPAIPLRGLTITAILTDVPGGFGSGSRIAPDATFTIQHLHGRTDFELPGAPPDWSIEAVVVNGRNLLDDPLEFKGTERIANAEIVLTNRHAQLAGIVADGSGSPQADYDVIVFPEDARLLRNPARWARLVRADASGRFLVGDLPAGDYVVLAVHEADETQWATPEYLAPLRPYGTRVSLASGERKSLALTIAARR